MLSAAFLGLSVVNFVGGPNRPPLTFLRIRITISHNNSCMHAHKYREVRAITPNDHELLVQSMSEFRYIVFGRFAPSILRTFKDFDYSLAQVASLFIVDEKGELTIKQVLDCLSAQLRLPAICSTS